MLKLAKLMTNLMVLDLRKESKVVVSKVSELLNTHFPDGKVKDKSKGDMVTVITEFQNQEKTVKATIEVHVDLHVTDPKKPIAWLEGSMEGEKKAEQQFKSECTNPMFKAKKALDAILSDFKKEAEKKEANSVDLPKTLTDDAWKRIKNTTLTDTGLGKALREWEEARKALDKNDLTGKIISHAEEKLDVVYRTILITQEKASENWHQASIQGLQAMSKLVKPAKKELEEIREKYVEWIDGWAKGRSGDIKKMEFWDLQVRGYISKGVVEFLKRWKEATEKKNKQAIEESVEELKAAVKELERLRKGALEEFNSLLKIYRAKGAPEADDWTESLKELAGDLRRLMEKINANCKLTTEKLQKAIG